MHVTICIPTRDRGTSIVRTLRSLLASSYSDWDAVIVDQSRTDATACALQALIQEDPRFRYVASTTRGSSAARNLALAHARGPFIAFTDDDCEVPAAWLAHLVAYYHQHPDSGLIYGAVDPGPHDPSAGFIPTCPIHHFRRIASPLWKWRERGIGANMAGPLAVLRAVGGFDEALGSGGPLLANLDADLTYRVLKAGYVVLNVPDAAVVHYGFRTWEQGRRLMRGVGIGVGATYMKHLRLCDPAVLPTFVIEWLRCISWGRLLTLRRHVGLGRFLGYGMGVVLSFRYPIDPHLRVYRTPGASQTEEASQADQHALIPLISVLPGSHGLSAPLLSTSSRWQVPLHLALPILPFLGSTWLVPFLLLLFVSPSAAWRSANGLLLFCRGLMWAPQ